MSENKRSRRVLLLAFFGIYVALILSSIASCLCVEEDPFANPFAATRLNSAAVIRFVQTPIQTDPFASDQDGFDGRGGIDSEPSRPPFEYKMVWPMEWCKFNAKFYEDRTGRLYALYHFRTWQISWLSVVASLLLFGLISWLASIGVSYLISKTGLRISLSTFFALTVIVAFSLKGYHTPWFPQYINPLAYQIQLLIASFANWVATLACYLSVFVGFQPRFIYHETLLYIRSSRARALESA